MNPIDILIYLAIGALAGWLASVLLKFRGLNLLGNVVVGIIGSLVGAWVFGFVGISASGIVGSIVMATAGAVLLLFAVKLIRK